MPTSTSAESYIPLSHYNANITTATDGTQDISGCIVQFLRNAQTMRRACLVIPPGVWTIKNPVNVDLDRTATGVATMCHVKIKGYGPQVTMIRVPTDKFVNSDVFNLPMSDRKSSLEIEDIGFLAVGSSMSAGKYLIKSVGKRVGGQMNRTIVMRNIYIGGYNDLENGSNTANEYFKNLFDFSLQNRVLIENVICESGQASGVYAISDWSNASPLWTTERAFVLDGVYAPEVRNCVISKVRYPIICRGAVPLTEVGPVNFTYKTEDLTTMPEVGVFENNRFPTCIIGITWDRFNAEPGLSIRNNFIDFRDYGCRISGARMADIVGNTFVQKTIDSGDYGNRDDPKDIRLTNVRGINISGNFFQGANPDQGEDPNLEYRDPKRTLIDIHNTGFADGTITKDVSIINNFIADAVYGEHIVWIRSNVQGVTYKDMKIDMGAYLSATQFYNPYNATVYT